MIYSLVDEGDPRCITLRDRLDDFYSATTEYVAFHEPAQKPAFWNPIVEQISLHLEDHDSCTVLEFGAGCTAFGEFLGALKKRVEFHVQDVTPQNREYLTTQADVVHISDIHEIASQFDVIFSTFVWEHVSDPRSVLNHLLGLLRPGGSLFLASPRYDFPFYLSPSAKHLSVGKRIGMAIWLSIRRLKVCLGGKPDFFIHLDPAVFHRPWFRDADAIHWVSLWDLKGYLSESYELSRHRIMVSGARARFWESFLLMFIQIRRSC